MNTHALVKSCEPPAVGKKCMQLESMCSIETLFHGEGRNPYLSIIPECRSAFEVIQSCGREARQGA